MIAMEYIIPVITSLLASVLSGLLLYYFKENKRLKELHKRELENAQKQASERQSNRDELLLGVARVLLNNTIMGALERGFTTQSEYEIVDELYKPYVANGGNGVVKHLFEDRYRTLKVK